MIENEIVYTNHTLYYSVMYVYRAFEPLEWVPLNMYTK